MTTRTPTIETIIHHADADALRTLYLDLVRGSLTGALFEDPPLQWRGPGVRPWDPAARDRGVDWPSHACSMIGNRRMLQLQQAAEGVIREGIRGDMIETGVWRGGSCILMRAVMKAHGVTDRTVWVADSFSGVPPPDPARYPQDRADELHTYAHLAVSQAAVEANFARYGLLDAQVRFLPGRFRDTLHAAPIASLAVLRLDGDMYESTMDALLALHDKVSPGGCIIVDDYGTFPTCRQAVDDFRRARGIDAPIVDIDGQGVWWRRA